MADRYGATGNIAAVTASPGDTALAVLATTLTRGRIYDILFSLGAAPADTVIQWLVRRFTAAGTEGSGVVPVALDSDAPAAQLDGAEGHTVEPTYTAATELFDEDLNQRGTFRWVAAPGGEFVVPAVASSGIGITPISAVYTGIARVTTHWDE